MWVGAHSAFTPNMWQWISGEDLQTGVPFWYYNEDYDGTRDCVSISLDYYNRLVDAHCELPLYVQLIFRASRSNLQTLTYTQYYSRDTR